MDSTLNQINQRLAALEQGQSTVQSTVAKTELDKMYEKLEAAHPNWRATNSSEGFKAWLAEVDPYVGLQRGALLQDAYEKQDAQRIIALFSGYQREQTTVKTGDTQPEPTSETPPAAAPQVDLETMVSPGGATEASTASAHGDEAGKPCFTHAEISQFYSEVTSGKWRGRDAEKAAMETAIIEAGREGRIR